MKKSLLIILIALIGFILIMGCSTQQQTTQQNIVSPTSSPQITSTQIASTPQTITPSVIEEKPVQITNLDANRHFLDIAFGRSTNNLKKNLNGLVYTLNGKYSESDKKIISDFAKDYNNFTSTKTFIDSPIVEKGDGMSINFYPQDYVKKLGEHKYQEIDPTTGDINFAMDIKYVESYHSLGPALEFPQFYINPDLTGNVRQHYIMKAMLLSIGFQGTTINYPDSFFYTGNNDKINLTPLDKAAINVMHDVRIINGMTFDSAKESLILNY